MVSSGWLFLLITWTAANSLAAAFALAALRRALRSTLSPKNMNSLRTDFAELASDYGKLFDMVSRLSKRQALADYKASKQQKDEQAPDDLSKMSKAELRRKFLHNRTHADIARLAMKGELQ